MLWAHAVLRTSGSWICPNQSCGPPGRGRFDPYPGRICLGRTVYLPTFTFTIKNQPNLGRKYTGHMDPYWLRDIAKPSQPGGTTSISKIQKFTKVNCSEVEVYRGKVGWFNCQANYPCDSMIIAGKQHIPRIQYGNCWTNKLKTRWWFRICFIFIPIWGRFPIWLIFFKGVETTNQFNSVVFFENFRTMITSTIWGLETRWFFRSSMKVILLGSTVNFI